MNSIINVERNTVIKSVLFLVFNTPFFMIKNFVRSKNLINKRVNIKQQCAYIDLSLEDINILFYPSLLSTA